MLSASKYGVAAWIWPFYTITDASEGTVRPDGKGARAQGADPRHGHLVCVDSLTTHRMRDPLMLDLTTGWQAVVYGLPRVAFHSVAQRKKL